MKANFLVGWNDEYLDLRLIAGPFGNDKKREMLEREVCKILMKIGGIDEKKAMEIVRTNEHSDFNLNIYEDGASVSYGNGYEDRIQVVQYDMEQKIEVDTPVAKIFSKVMPDEEYPGIATLIDIPGEPGIIMEYDPNKGHIVSRVYSVEDPDGDPCSLISFEK